MVSAMLESLLQDLARLLRADLPAFANRRTKVGVEVLGSTIRCSWTQGREPRAEVFILDDDDHFFWLADGEERRSYRAFLRSETMADLDGLAEATQLKYSQLPSLVPPEAVVEHSVGSSEHVEASLETMTALVEARLSNRPGVTTIYFVKGDAGAGKTTLLQQLVRHRASGYDDHPTFQFLYVSAQGRLLSNLPDALAAETQDLSARFRNDAVAVLARRRLLVPVIDGFDELLGTAGYSDAFSSLQSLLGELHGAGVVIVSARSSFYETEFVQRGQAFDASAYDVTPITLQPWSDARLEQYLRVAVEPANIALTLDTLRDLGQTDRDLLHRPFFAARFPGYARERIETGKVLPLLERLVDRYIEREASKIVDAGGSPLLSVDGHRQIFEEASEQMWTSGDRRLNTEDLRELTDIIAEQNGVSEANRSQLSTKITSYAGFTLTEARDAFVFEHEVYFDHFLSQAGKRMVSSGSLPQFLDHGILPGRVVAEIARSATADELLHAIDELSLTASRVNRRLNAGALVVANARLGGNVVGRRVAGLEILGEDLTNCVFERCEFVDCHLADCDFSNAQFPDCSWSQSSFTGLRVTDRVTLLLSADEIYECVTSVIDPEEGDEVFDPSRILEILQAAGVVAPSQHPRLDDQGLGPRARAAIALLERLNRRFRRTTLFVEDAEDGAARIS